MVALAVAKLKLKAMHSVEPLHGNSPTDIELILVLREPFGLLYPPKKNIFPFGPT